MKLKLFSRAGLNFFGVSLPATVEDRVLLLLSIKEKGKLIDFNHIAEKVIRDEKGKITAQQLRQVLDKLVSEGLVRAEREGYYAIAERGYQLIVERLEEVGDYLNLSYRMVFKAKQYYPQVAEILTYYLKDRPTSVVKVFSDEEDPIHRIKPLFVRYARYKPKPVNIFINSSQELLRYVDDHAIDFIPYVHKQSSNMPDWLIIDMDAGPKFWLHPRGFDLIKVIANSVAEVLEENDVTPYLKFSGSRGIQIWASFRKEDLPKVDDYFALYRKLAILIRDLTEQKLQSLSSSTLDEFYKVVTKGKPITTSQVAKKEEREDQVLLDWSSMKPAGDVRAPFSLHHKTGLISCPIMRKEILTFTPDQAEPVKVAEKAAKLFEAFKLEPSSPSKLLSQLKEYKPPPRQLTLF